MKMEAIHVQRAFEQIRSVGFAPNSQSKKWDVIDPKTGDRFPPKAVLRIAKELAKDQSYTGGGGWPTNDPLIALNFEIALKNEPESAEIDDLQNITDSTVPETMKQRLANARLGQGGFRSALIEIWGGKCAITGCDVGEVLRASHIKPWRESSNVERLDPRNGLLLAASIDALFDKHLITVRKSGGLRARSPLTQSSLELIGLSKGLSVRVHADSVKYLENHRAEFKSKSNGRSFSH